MKYYRLTRRRNSYKKNSLKVLIGIHGYGHLHRHREYSFEKDKEGGRKRETAPIETKICHSQITH